MADASSSGKADALTIEQRRDKIRHLRYDEGLAIFQIQARLKEDGIEIGKSQIGRDLQVIQREIRNTLTATFDGPRFIANTIYSYERRAYKLLSMITEKIEPVAAAALVRAANDCTQKVTELLQDVGILDRRLGTLIFARPDDGKKVERVPTGEEMQQFFDGITIKESELVSDAERAWLYGDIEHGQSEEAGESVSRGSGEESSEEAG